MRDLFDRQLEMYHQRIDELQSMSDWARREQLYNCSRFYEEKKSPVQKVASVIRVNIASVLRKAADVLDPGLTA